MSDLYRSALNARIAKLPQLPPEDDDESEEAADSLGALPGRGMGPPPMPARHPRKARTPNPEYAAISAADFFSEAVQADIPSRQLDCRVYYSPPAFSDGTVMICHHGAGYSGLTFACFAKEVVDITKGACGVLAMDARRHGKTTSVSESEDEDLSIDVLTADFVAMIQTIFPDPSTAPTFLLVGHSMGGSVIVRSCSTLLEQKYRITGAAVLDVVEGTAVEALPHMHSLLNTRPEGFASVEEAVEWHIVTKTIRNPQSARVSIPPILVPDCTQGMHYKWRTPLRSTAPYWLSWFKGLSSTFLQTRTARILVLAGKETLDDELMIGQMQGKFQLAIVPGVGHMLQEDEPKRLAEILVEFWKRNDRVIAGVKKVGDL